MKLGFSLYYPRLSWGYFLGRIFRQFSSRVEVFDLGVLCGEGLGKEDAGDIGKPLSAVT